MSLSIGMELEFSSAPYEFTHEATNGNSNELDPTDQIDQAPTDWTAVGDGSISGEAPTELVSPPMPDLWTALGELDRVMDAADSYGAEANSSCGFHVHIGSAENHAHDWQTARAAWVIMSRSVDAFLFAELAKRGHERHNNYCVPFGHGTSSRGTRGQSPASIGGPAQLFTRWYEPEPTNYPAHDLAFMTPHHGKYDSSRYQATNLHAFWTYGTVEFRHFPMVCSYRHLAAYVRTCYDVMSYATEHPNDRRELTESTCYDSKRQDTARIFSDSSNEFWSLKLHADSTPEYWEPTLHTPTAADSWLVDHPNFLKDGGGMTYAGNRFVLAHDYDESDRIRQALAALNGDHHNLNDLEQPHTAEGGAPNPVIYAETAGRR